MLKRLIIKNYALISSVSIDFGPGLSIITGETGAGKSIMLGALTLLMGNRADTKVVRDKTGKSVVEAVFSAGGDLEQFFTQNQLDWDADEIIVRREISASGRSRAFINDTPVNLKLLGDITAALIDIHSQNSNLLLSDPRRQLQIIDSLADNDSQLSEYKAAFKAFVKMRNNLQDLRNRISRHRENENFMRFQLSQLEKLSPKPGELAALEQEAEILGDAEEIKLKISNAVDVIDAAESGAVSRLAEARHLLAKVNFSLLERDSAKPGNGLLQRLESVYVELKDIAATLESILDSVNDDPRRLEIIQKRMDDIYDAVKRFKTEDDAGLKRIYNELKKQLDGIDGTETDIAGIETQLKDMAKGLKEKAEKLSESRVAAAERFSELLTATARPLGMSNLKFSVLLSKGKLTAEGQDNVDFLCAFNKNQDLMPVASVASGGETSRLMLGIKAIIANHVNLPSIIFDEVDTGVSGEVADRMGRMMRDMGNDIQVIAITHLPQVAAKGRNHYKVYKADDEEKTVTNISLLSDSGRVAEIAAMLSGSSVDRAALLNAESLLKNADK